MICYSRKINMLLLLAVVLNSVSLVRLMGLDESDYEEFLCTSKSRVIYPTQGITENKENHAILNSGDFKQAVHIEECRNENATCNYVDILPHNMKSLCRQVYTTHELATLSENGTAIKETFVFPSACKCVIKRTEF